MIRKILKWTGIIILSLILVLVIAVVGRQNLQFNALYPAVMATADNGVIAHGKEIAFGPAHCAEWITKMGWRFKNHQPIYYVV